MARKGRIENLQLGGRQLRLKIRLQTFSEEELIEFESEVLNVIRNLDKTVRNETMHDIANNTVRRAIEILQDSKQDSQAFSDINSRSQGLEDSLKRIRFTETDAVTIEPPKDIDYAAITDMAGSVEIVPQTAEFLQFYWFRFGFVRKAKAVHRPGNEYLSKAIREEATTAKISEMLDKKLIHEWKNRDNITSQGGNLGTRKRRSNVPPARRRRNAARS
jgi:hypothetical protein